jgi:hypothetical protein
LNSDAAFKGLATRLDFLDDSAAINHAEQMIGGHSGGWQHLAAGWQTFVSVAFFLRGAQRAGVRETALGGLDDARGQSVVNNVLNGWALGGGIEARLWGNWSAKVEYLHLDFNGTSTTSHVTGAPVAGVSVDYMNLANSHVTDDIARVGLNYRFWNTPVRAQRPRPRTSGTGMPTIKDEWEHTFYLWWF